MPSLASPGVTRARDGATADHRFHRLATRPPHRGIRRVAFLDPQSCGSFGFGARISLADRGELNRRVCAAEPRAHDGDLGERGSLGRKICGFICVDLQGRTARWLRRSAVRSTWSVVTEICSTTMWRSTDSFPAGSRLRFAARPRIARWRIGWLRANRAVTDPG